MQSQVHSLCTCAAQALRQGVRWWQCGSVTLFRMPHTAFTGSARTFSGACIGGRGFPKPCPRVPGAWSGLMGISRQGRTLQDALHDLRLGAGILVVVVPALEGVAAAQHGEQHDAGAPDVRQLSIVLPRLQHLWRCARAESLSATGDCHAQHRITRERLWACVSQLQKNSRSRTCWQCAPPILITQSSDLLLTSQGFPCWPASCVDSKPHRQNHGASHR